MSRRAPSGGAASAGSLQPLAERWMAAWPTALEAWSRFTRLRPPALCLTVDAAKEEGLTGSFAMIRLTDQSVVVSLPEVVSTGIEDLGVEVLAHEIGHHVLAPATLTDHARMIARMRWALPTIEAQAPLVANLYTDLLINDRLQRSAGLRIAEVYRRIAGVRDVPDGAAPSTPAKPRGGAVWALYTRIYELLWNLERGALGGSPTDDRMEGDAWLGARLVRSYARDWLDGSGRFAALLLPYLLDDRDSAELLQKLYDTRDAAIGGDPAGLTGEDPGEREGAVHPVHDPRLGGTPGDGEQAAEPVESTVVRTSTGQARQPFEYGEILRAAGIVLDDHQVAVRYYRERATPYLVPFPYRSAPAGSDPLPEGLEPWDLGHPLDDLDWLQSVLVSPRVVPGVTTVQRLWGTSPGQDPEKEPLDLDIYVDSSGSMANPQHTVSYPALAGAIITLSALRAGARVQATLWSGKHDVTTTRGPSGEDGFVRDEEAILRVLTGYYGGGTQFPIHILRDTFAARRPDARPAHVLIVSDDGVATLFDNDERGNSGWDVAREALRRARGGGTMVLQLQESWETPPSGGWLHEVYGAIKRARDEEGWNVHRVASWDDLVAFAHAFSRLRYGREEPRGG